MRNGLHLMSYHPSSPEVLFAQAPDDWDRSLTGAERVLLAIFDRAVRDYHFPGDIPQHEERSAVWYFENPDKEEYGCLSHFCYHFELDFFYVRKKALSPKTAVKLLRDGRVGKGAIWKKRS